MSKLIKSGEQLTVRGSKLILISCCLVIILLILGIETVDEENQFSPEGIKQQEAPEEKPQKKPEEKLRKINYDSYQQWEELLANYQLNEAGRLVEIPNLRIVKFPEDINQINNNTHKKNIFLNILAIGTYHANQNLLQQRNKLKKIINQYHVFENLSTKDKEWLEEKFSTYDIKKEKNLEAKLEQLKKKLDIIPLSLVLAQAASESGWGTSRFAIEANNIFGEWTYNASTPGIVPDERPANANYRIRKFPSITRAIDSYLLNLNSHWAYQKLRDIRFELRSKDQSLDSLELSAGLIKYSETRELYVEQLNNIIKYNDLQAFDSLLQEKGASNSGVE
ncbi:MAG: glucosaminidase domain-containing protein [Bacillota bacterium]